MLAKLLKQKYPRDQRSFLLWAASSPLLSLNKNENTKYRKLATAIATPNASIFKSNKNYQRNRLHEVSNRFERMLFLGFEVVFESFMVGGVQGLVTGAWAVPENQGWVMWSLELAAVILITWM